MVVQVDTTLANVWQVDGDLAESIKRSAFDRLGDLGRRFKPGIFQVFSRHLASNRKLALVGKFLIKFYSLSAPTKIEELTAGSDEKTQRSPRRESNPGSLRILVARSNHWATKPQRELRVNFRLSPSCQFFFHYEVTRIARVYNTQRPTKTRWI